MNAYTYHIHLYDWLFIGTISIGLNFAVQLWFAKSLNRAGNRVLALALAAAALWMVRNVAIGIKLPAFSLAIGPLLYFYVLQRTRPEHRFKPMELLHFIPVLQQQAAWVPEMSENVTIGRFAAPVFLLLTLLSVLLYIYKSGRLIHNFYRRLQPAQMDRPLSEFRWLRRLLAGLGLLCLAWLADVIIAVFVYHTASGISGHELFYPAFVIMMTWIGAAAFFRSRPGTAMEVSPPYKTPVPAELKERGVWLKKMLQANLYYKDPGLTLNSLAEKLGLTTHELSRIINTALKKSFNDLINEYRIREVIRKMQDPAYANMTLLGAAYESGFNSESTFHRVFKELTGKTPAEHKKELPSYNLRAGSPLTPVISHHATNSIHMFRNYVTIAWRNLLRNNGFPVINIFCLVIGLTFSLLMGVYISDQAAINSDIKNVSDQYVIKSDWKHENMGLPITTLGPLAKTIREEYPGLVENYYRFNPVVNIVSYGDKHFRTQMSVGDTTLVTMYGFPLLAGDPQHAFRNDQSAVVTEKFARKFFGGAPALDKVISIQTPADGQKHNFVITAVLRDLPFNSITGFTKHEYEVYLPMEANPYFQAGDKGDQWSNIYMAGMIQLKRGVTAERLQRPFADVLEKYQPAFVKGNLKIKLAAVRDYYLKDNNGSVQKMLTTLSFVTVFILMLAMINFVNISVGTSAYRLKEIGLRKVFGSSRRQLIAQYLTEALILTFIAGIMSLGFYELLRPVFNDLLDTVLAHVWQLGFGRFALIMGIMLLAGLIAGAYPAFVLSASNVTTAVKGKMDTIKGGLLLRKTLLIVQFTVAIVVFISAITVSRQVTYFFTQDIGYNKDQVMIVSSLPRQWDSAGIVKMENLKSQFSGIPGVQSVSLSYDIPDGNGGGNVYAYPQHSDNLISMTDISVDAGFAKTYGLKMVEGNFFSDGDINAISGKVVLNETAVKTFGWTSAVGKTIHIGTVSGARETVVGVVKDFNLGSMKDKVQPLIIAGLNDPSFARAYRYYSIKVKTRDISNTISGIEKKCRELFPEAGFESAFMDDKFRLLYQSELQLKRAADVATVLSLLIVFSGIIGVLAFTLTRRTKEIAVRKIVGANAGNIIFIFLKEYGLLILLSNAIAWPLAWFISARWLENYAYRFHQDAVPYLFVCVFVLFTASALITVQCFKTASTNPVKSLRTE